MKWVLTLVLTVLAVQSALALPDPAAVYCEQLGYEYKQVETPQGAKGIVIVEPGVEFDAWDFFKGKVGKEYAYGALYGYDTECVSQDMGTYVIEYAMCVSKQEGKKGRERIPLLDLMERNGEPLMVPEYSRLKSPVTGDSNNEEREHEPGYTMTGVRQAIPSEFDWRDKDGRSYIGSIRNQGSCGSCYAFAAAAAGEGTYNWATGNYDANCADFSESFIIWCLGRLPAYSNDFYGCDGASYDYAELTALCTEGVGNESDYAYTQSDPGTCTHWGDPATVFASWSRIDCGDVDAIKTAIMTYGVVDAAVYVTGSFYSYSSGVFSNTYTSCDGSPCYYTTVNHAIALVGWDDNPAEGGGGCWILRNSWGTSWGETGYMRISYQSAGVACEACYLVYGTNTHTLTVTSEYDGAVPAAGQHQYTHGANLTCMITNSPVYEGSLATQFVCVGWTGTGSVPAGGSDTNTGSFSFTNNSSIVWLWETNVYLSTELDAPTGVSASDGTYTNKVYVTWQSVAEAASYEVWRNTMNSSSTATNLASTALTHYDDTNAVLGVSFYYWIKAENYLATSDFSSSALGYVGPALSVINDYDRDGKSDLAVYHETSGYWYIVLSSSGSLSYEKLGESGYAPVTGDFDGDRKSDLAVYHETSGYWYIVLSSSGSLSYEKLGESGYAPVTGDYDGDGKTDLAVYHESTGYWFLIYSSSWALSYSKLGESGYTPVPGDYDGDGKTDFAVYHEATGWWYYVFSSSGSLSYSKFGDSDYTPVFGDFDGDGKTDLAIYHEATGYWYIIYSNSWSFAYSKLGELGYTPISGDYDGDGKTDLAVYHEATGYWYIIYSSTLSLSYTQFGGPGYEAVK